MARVPPFLSPPIPSPTTPTGALHWWSAASCQGTEPEKQLGGTSSPVTPHRAGKGRGLELWQTGTGLHTPSGNVNKELMVKETERSPKRRSYF